MRILSLIGILFISTSSQLLLASSDKDQAERLALEDVRGQAPQLDRALFVGTAEVLSETATEFVVRVQGGSRNQDAGDDARIVRVAKNRITPSVATSGGSTVGYCAPTMQELMDGTRVLDRSFRFDEWDQPVTGRDWSMGDP